MADELGRRRSTDARQTAERRRLVLRSGRRYTAGMSESTCSALFVLLLPVASAQTIPPGWKLIRDPSGACQLAVPPEWTPLSANGGSAVLHDPGTAIAVVTSQPGQAFKPLSPTVVKLIEIPKEKMFENTAKRIFYEDKTSQHSENPSAYTTSVPGGKGTCSCRVVFLPNVGEETSRKIALSLGPIPETMP